MPSIQSLKASDGSGNANTATVTVARTAPATTIQVDTVTGIPTNFHATMGTPHTFSDPVTGEDITVISEATAVDFKGHVDGSNLEIDTIAPGYTDGGSEVGDIVIIRPTTQWADEVVSVLQASLDDDGSMQQAAIAEGLGSTRGVLGNVNYYTSSDTWTKPTGLKFVEIIAKGGGGGGGGVGTTSGNGGSGGGGEGETVLAKVAAASLSATETVTVGAGGAGGTGSATNGSPGGSSSFGSHAIANGGTGGTASVGNVSFKAGGAGGTGGTGDISIAGAIGHASADNGSQYLSGAGGGAGGGTPSSASTGGNGVANSGGGGAGSVGTGTTSRNGGVGGSGYVIVKEYY